MRRVIGVSALIAVLAVIIGAQSSGAGSAEVKINVGSKVLTFPAGTKPKIAFFDCIGTLYCDAQKKVVAQIAAKGTAVTFIGQLFNPTQQLNQVQTAIQSKKYNAFILEAADANAMCQVLTKDAPKAGIVVSVLVSPICGKTLNPWGVSEWSPGTLNIVGGQDGPTYYTNWLRLAKKQLNLGPTSHVLLVTGPPESPATQTLALAMKNAGINAEATLNTNFTTPDAQNKTQTALQAHSHINAIISIYSDCTRGVLNALKSAGQLGKIPVTDVGASKYTVGQVRAGNVALTVPYSPRENATTSIQQIVNAFAGKQGPRAVNAMQRGDSFHPYAITKANASTWQAEW